MHAPFSPELSQAILEWNTIDQRSLGRKISALLAGDMQEENKLTRQEWKTLKIFASNREHLDKQFEVFHQFVNYVEERTASPNHLIVCVQNFRKKLDFNYRQEQSIIVRIVIVVSFFFFPKYTHIYFSNFELGIYTSHGKKSEHGVYNNVTNGIAPAFHEEYEINIEALKPLDLPSEDLARFKTVFFTNLRTLISDPGRPVTPLSAWDFIKLLLPSWETILPSDIQLSSREIRPMSCAQFVGEAIIEAHRQTCSEFGYDFPDVIEAYGLAEAPERLLTTALVTGFVARGIFVPRVKYFI